MRWMLLVLGGLLPGCRELEIERWEPTDYEALLEALARPEGDATQNREAVRSEFLGVRDRLDALQQGVTLLDPLIARDDGFEERAVDTRAVRGTNLFVHVACPGPDLDNPVRDFSAGRLRVESPELLLQAARRWQLRGDVLTVAEECEIGRFVVRGASPGYIDEDNRAVALDIRFEFELEEQRTTQLSAEVVFSADSVASLLRYRGDTYAVNLEYSANDTLFIRGSDGAYVCALDDLELPCERIVA